MFLTHHYRDTLNSAKGQHGDLKFEPIDRHLGEGDGSIVVEFALTLDGGNYQALFTRYESKLDKRRADCLRSILESQALTHGTVAAWFPYRAAWGNRVSQFSFVLQELVKQIRKEQVLTDQEWSALWHSLTGKNRGGLEQHWIPQTLELINPTQLKAPEVKLIPAIRRVGDAESTEVDDYSGLGIIERLAKLQNPSHDQQRQKQRFEEINTFLREVTGSPTATIEIPYERDTVLVHMDGKTLPLRSLGTGVHEVVILATAATVLRNQAICIEEPELHLHPLLQKKLLQYLQEKTDNQYFITTHSAHLLDTQEAAIFHVRYQDGQSTVIPAHTATEKSDICADLGYRASDLMQANCVIWVEGPSDRIYLNHWIRAINPNFVEGLHYSIMFYGGRLLSHLSANDPEIEDFISLRRLNRYITIVIDSDRPAPRKQPNPTKKRIKDEFGQGPGFAWITKGREIENYVPPHLLEEAVKRVHKQALKLDKTGPYDRCLQYRTAKGELKDKVDKVKVARELTASPADLDVLDLRQMMTRLVEFIQESNNLVET